MTTTEERKGASENAGKNADGKSSESKPEALDTGAIMREYYRNRFLHYKESRNSDEQFSG